MVRVKPDDFGGLFMKFRSIVTAGLGLTLVAGLVAPSAAIAAQKPDTPVVKQVDENTKSLTTVSPTPTEAQKQQGRATIQAAEAADPAAFAERVNLIRASPKTLAFLKSFKGLDVNEQISGLAASMPTEPLIGFTGLVEAGAIEFKVKTIKNGWYSTEMIVHEQPLVQTRDLGSLPRCPSAWAAFWAWFAVNVTTCGAFAPFPVAAFACAAGFAVGGAIIDFNRGC